MLSELVLIVSQVVAVFAMAAAIVVRQAHDRPAALWVWMFLAAFILQVARRFTASGVRSDTRSPWVIVDTFWLPQAISLLILIGAMIYFGRSFSPRERGT